MPRIKEGATRRGGRAAGRSRTAEETATLATPWRFLLQKALYVAERNGWTRFVSMQNHLNLIYREEEREMLPLCVAEGVASTPYSPLAAGRLARNLAETTRRYETDPIAKNKYDATADADQVIIASVAEVAAD